MVVVILPIINSSNLIVTAATGSYLSIAENLLHQHKFLNAAGMPDTFRMLGYPLLHALMFAVAEIYI